MAYRRISFVSGMLVLLILCCTVACSRKGDVSEPDTAVTIAPGQDTVVSTTPAIDEGVNPSDSKTDKSDTPVNGQPTAGPDAATPIPDITDTEPAPGDGGTVSPTSVPENSEDDDSDDFPVAGNDTSDDGAEQDPRAEAWKDTFLAWLPMYEDGAFLGVEVEDTFDYAVITDASEESVRTYIALLQTEGFLQSVETQEKKNNISYSAANSDNWFAVVEYNAGDLKIGSGYKPAQSASDKYSELRSTSLLGRLPEFAEGTFNSGSGEAGYDSYAVFDDVSIEYIREYISSLKAAGFTVDPDEGDTDGFVWYTAEDADGYLCDLTYYDSAVKISCGQ